MPRLTLVFSLLLCAGCAIDRDMPSNHSVPPTTASNMVLGRVTLPSSPPAGTGPSPVQQANRDVQSPVRFEKAYLPETKQLTPARPVAYNAQLTAPAPLANAPRASAPKAGTLLIDGRNYQVQLIQEQPQMLNMHDSPVAYQDTGSTIDHVRRESVVQLNLPSVLAMVDGHHPAVGIAQWRVREAYAQLARADVLWLPTIQAGFSFHRHDGNYQASDGSIVDVNRNSFQYGLGTGATGAGTAPQPGLLARFHLADAIFQPKVAERTAWARDHAAKAVLNKQLLTAATAYLDLLDAHQDMRILEESRTRTFELSKITSDFADAGEGLQADADRLDTELALLDNRMVGTREQIAIASARLAQAVSMETGNEIMPTDVTVVPLEMANLNLDKPSLISTGLSTRPELHESQAFVAAACEAFRREKFTPLVPSVVLGFSTGGFGGGLGDNLANINSRYDFDASMSWDVRNLGFGEKAARQESSARLQQARFEKLRVMDQVAREVSEAASQVEFRREQMAITQRAIQSAESSYELNLSRIRDGKGLPLEVLQSVQALESARRAYLRSVVDYNRAQFQLQWALGWPVEAHS